MADQFPVQTDTAATSVESFIADRQSMWARFNRLTVVVVTGLVILLLLMWFFLA